MTQPTTAPAISKFHQYKRDLLEIIENNDLHLIGNAQMVREIEDLTTRFYNDDTEF